MSVRVKVWRLIAKCSFNVSHRLEFLECLQMTRNIRVHLAHTLEYYQLLFMQFSIAQKVLFHDTWVW